jgi:N-acetylmuramoyl-L-alanine amidase
LTVTFASGRQQEYNFQLAYLNPADYVSGIQARLKNLGDYKGEINGNMDDASRDAIRRFQERSGLEATGQANAATKNALLQLHGS